MSSERFAAFGGVSFSGAREPLSTLWTVLATGAEDELTVVDVRPHAYRTDLAGFVAEGWRALVDRPGAALWSVDFPCGLDTASAGVIGGDGADWATLLRWVADRPPDEVRDAVPADVRGARIGDPTGVSPLDSRVYKQTIEGHRWLAELRDACGAAVYPQAADSDADVAVVETAPAVSVRELGLPRRRTPSRPGETRARAAALRTYVRFATPGAEAVVTTIDSAWDAAVGCITAWMARSDLAQPEREPGLDAARIGLEGWVYRPPAALVSGAPPGAKRANRRRGG